MASRVHAFGDDVLADHDGVAIAALVRAGQLSAQEVAEAALARAGKVDPVLRAVAGAPFERPRLGDDTSAPLYGVPTFVKDNTDLQGVPTNHGSEGLAARIPRHSALTATARHGTARPPGSGTQHGPAWGPSLWLSVAACAGKAGPFAGDTPGIHLDGFHADRAPGADCRAGAEHFIPAERDTGVRRAVEHDQIGAEQAACEQS
jgi:hypothetical protein